ncbi:protein kinase domain-containing protein [Geodermatophilus maliterrae]|uniref:non-specific serine/threonine protein kinase n=1 Tax=Geodermatophilus maliterrae TaxID=3162531 RepID=A0ABV3X9A0_9ACTN
MADDGPAGGRHRHRPGPPDDGEPDLPRVLAVLTQVAQALDHAHRLDVVHRDVKPANVLLRTADPVDAALGDFGIAQFLDEAAPLAPRGRVAGSVPYASPEVLRAHRLTPATDVYSLTCTPALDVDERQRPPVHRRMSGNGVPYGGILLTALVTLFGVALNAFNPGQAFEIVLNMSALGARRGPRAGRLHRRPPGGGQPAAGWQHRVAPARGHLTDRTDRPNRRGSRRGSRRGTPAPPGAGGVAARTQRRGRRPRASASVPRPAAGCHTRPLLGAWPSSGPTDEAELLRRWPTVAGADDVLLAAGVSRPAQPSEAPGVVGSVGRVAHPTVRARSAPATGDALHPSPERSGP